MTRTHAIDQVDANAKHFKEIWQEGLSFTLIDTLNSDNFCSVRLICRFYFLKSGLIHS